MEEEKWIYFEEGKGQYQISSFGRMRSFVRSQNKPYIYRISEYHIRRNKYRQVLICGKQYLLHKLIAKYFVPNPNNKPFVNHKNCVKYDNHPDNLEWVTHQENIVHAFLNGKMEFSKSLNKLYNHVTFQKIIQYQLTGEFVRVWNSLSEAARYFDIHKYSIFSAIKRNGTCRKFQWRYYEEPLIENIGKYKSKHRRRVLLQLDDENRIVKEYASINEATKMMNVSSSFNFVNVVKYNIKYMGYYWKYKNEKELI